MRQEDDLGLQNWEFLNAQMKTSIFWKSVVFVALLSGWILAGCSSDSSQVRERGSRISINSGAWKGLHLSRVANLTIAANSGDNQTFTTLVEIKEAEFAQSVFQDLAQGNPVLAKRYFLISPKLFVFIDERDTVLCSFLYWPAGKPQHIFSPCKIKGSNGTYRVEWPASQSPSVVLPRFDERIQAYLDVWK